MNATYSAIALAAFAIAGAGPGAASSIALDEGHGAHGDSHPESHEERHAEHRERHREHHKAKHARMARHEREEDRHFSRTERDEIGQYYAAHRGEGDRDEAQGRHAAGAVRVVVGQPIADEEWRHRLPLPHEVLARLPPPPPGVVVVRIHDHVVKVREQTHEVLDDMGLPPPP
jgi:hypothetical protein